MKTRVLMLVMAVWVSGCSLFYPRDDIDIDALPPTATGDIEIREGFVKREVWSSLNGGNYRSLFSDVRFPVAPDVFDEIDALEYSDLGNNYGVRIRGYLLPPADGDYRFSISADRTAQFWLSSTELPDDATLVAYTQRAGAPGDFSLVNTQVSKLVTLQAGQRYFFEVFHKENTGADHLLVAWEGPNMNTQAIAAPYMATYLPPPGNLVTGYKQGYRIGFVDAYFEYPYNDQNPPADTDQDGLPDNYEQAVLLDANDPNDASLDVDGDVLTAADEYFQLSDPTLPDTDNDGIDDGLERLYGLDPRNAGDALGDADGDGATNLQEVQLGSNPIDSSSLPEGLTPQFSSSQFLQPESGLLPGTQPIDPELKRERWDNLGGRQVDNLVRDAAYPRLPSENDSVLSLAYSGLGDRYGTRIRGYLRPPFPGAYRFYVSGDEAVEFWLSHDELEDNVRLVAFNRQASLPDQFDVQNTQVSEQIVLESGQRYFFELFHKELNGDDHVSVQWEGPGMLRQVVGEPYTERYLAFAGTAAEGFRQGYRIGFTDGGHSFPYQDSYPPLDSDGDGLPDNFELASGLDPFDPSDVLSDRDGDLLTAFDEYILRTDPNNADSDGDLISDGLEVLNELDALNPADASQDADGDGFSNLDELLAFTDIRDPASAPPPPVVDTPPAGGFSAVLSWNPPLNRADGSPLAAGDIAEYRVYYGTAPDQLTQQTSVNPSLTSITFEGLQADTYYFALTVIDSDGNESAFSEVVAHTLDDSGQVVVDTEPSGGDGGTSGPVFIAGDPDQDFDGDGFSNLEEEQAGSDPQNADSVPPSGTASAVLSWTAPAARADGSPLFPEEIAEYRIYYGTAPDQLNQQTSVGASLTQVTFDGLEATTYYFGLTVVDTEGNESALSELVVRSLGNEVVVDADTDPGTTDPGPADPGTDPADPEPTDPEPTDTAQTDGSAGGDGSTADSGGSGTGTGSGTSTGGSVGEEDPADTSGFSALLSWSAPTSRADGSSLATGDIAEYRVYYGTELDQLDQQRSVDGSETEALFSDLQPATYYFGLTVVDTQGNESALSDVVSRTVDGEVAVASESSAGIALLSWQPPSAREDGSPLATDQIASFVIHHGNNPDALDGRVVVSADTTEYEFSGLSSGVHYFSVSVVDDSGLESQMSGQVQKNVP